MSYGYGDVFMVDYYWDDWGDIMVDSSPTIWLS